jgi:predicted GH43/DUF377 family glycosyl hydrolase
MKKKYIIIISLFVLFLIIAANDESNTVEISTSTNTSELTIVTNDELTFTWKEYKNNPVIRYNDVIDGILWGDPSVMKEWDTYKMWLSGGKPFDTPLVVKIYYATSNDGINWDIQKEPILESSDGAWDSESVETPEVIKVGSTYHMYYTWYNTNFQEGRYSMGHATSSDGINWIKDTNNPIMKPQEDPLKWGFYTTAEPAVVYDDGMFYLYYTSAKSNYPEEWSPFWIMLVTSKDGSTFKNPQIVYTLTDSYDELKFRWYSTPSVYIKEGVFYLYHDLVYDPDGFEQVWISSAKSLDWVHFEEFETDIFTINNGDWKDTWVLAPSVMVDGDTVKMWFTGRRDTPNFDFGIWYATKQL